MKVLLIISMIHLIRVEGYKLHFSDEEKEVETRGVKDTEPPKLLSCPSCFEISTTKSKVRGDWPIPTYSDNCGTTCFINITSNHRPLDFQQAGTSIEVRYTAEDPSGNKNVACKFTVRIKDIGHPTLLSCPKDIVVSTNKRSITVDWTIPGYSDNCGPNCLLRITSNYQPLYSRFLLGKTTEVHYEARDPSGNSNIDCVFTVDVKAPSCRGLAPPKNGMLTEFGTSLVYPSCKRGFYPARPFPFFYTCKKENWQEFPSTRIITKVPDCILKTPPPGSDMALYFFYTYDGDCNSAAAQAQAKQNLWIMGFCTGDCSINKLKSNCGQTTV